MLDKVFNHVGAGHFHFLGSALVNLSSCVLLDRFRAMKSVDVLDSEAHRLMKQNKFLASKYPTNVVTETLAPQLLSPVLLQSSILCWLGKKRSLSQIKPRIEQGSTHS